MFDLMPGPQQLEIPDIAPPHGLVDTERQLTLDLVAGVSGAVAIEAAETEEFNFIGETLIIYASAKNVIAQAYIDNIERGVTERSRDIDPNLLGDSAQVTVDDVQIDADGREWLRARVLQEDGHAQPEVGTLYLPKDEVGLAYRLSRDGVDEQVGVVGIKQSEQYPH